MKQHQLVVSVRFRPETLERILRVVRHRGFCLCAITMDTQNDNMSEDLTNNTNRGNNITIALTVASQRPVELLYSQLCRLVDVLHVEISAINRQRAFSEPTIDQPFLRYTDRTGTASICKQNN